MAEMSDMIAGGQNSSPLINPNMEDEPRFNGFRITALLFKHKFFIILFTLLATGVSIFIALNITSQYVAAVSVVPPKTPTGTFESSGGSISSALKDFGFTQLGANIEGYSFMVILTSRTLTDSMIYRFDLSRRYEIPMKKMTQLRNEFIDNIEISIEKAGNYTVSIWDTSPDTAALMANTFVKLANIKALELYKSEAKFNRIYLEERISFVDSALKRISDSLSTFSQKNLLFSPADQAQSVSKAFAELKAKSMENDIYYELYKNTYGEKDPYTEFYGKLRSELSKQVEEAETKPGFAGNFTMKEAAGIGIKYIRLYTEFETFSKVKAFLLPMLEKARLDEQRYIQNLFVVDEALPPDKKDRPKRSVIVAGTALGSFVFAILVIMGIDGIRRSRRLYKNYREKTN